MRFGDDKCGDIFEFVVVFFIIQEFCCSLVVCFEKKGELNSVEVCGEVGTIQEGFLMDFLDKLCDKDVFEFFSIEVKKQCIFGF